MQKEHTEIMGQKDEEIIWLRQQINKEKTKLTNNGPA
jgi:hypothetical protein